LAFSIDLLRRPYNTLALACECVIYSHKVGTRMELQCKNESIRQCSTTLPTQYSSQICIYSAYKHIQPCSSNCTALADTARQTLPYLIPHLNPLNGTLKPQNNGPLDSDTVIGTLAADWWAGAPLSPLLAVPNVTAHPSTASVPTFNHLMWHYNCL